MTDNQSNNKNNQTQSDNQPNKQINRRTTKQNTYIHKEHTQPIKHNIYHHQGNNILPTSQTSDNQLSKTGKQPNERTNHQPTN